MANHLKNQDSVDHGSALAIPVDRREINELKKRLHSLEAIKSKKPR